MKILLVEDETKLSAALQKGLKKLGFATDAAFDGEEALELIGLNPYDLVILDLNLPKRDGFEVLTAIRKTSNTMKVLILSARGDVQDKVRGLDLGANDYMGKPFDFLELSARIQNLLRWDFTVRDDIISFRQLAVHIGTKEVMRDGETLRLTNKEYGILEYLAMHRDRYVSAEELIGHVWDSEADLFSNSFKFHMSSLKKKLQTEGAIVNIRGKGYRFGEETHENAEK